MRWIGGCLCALLLMSGAGTSGAQVAPELPPGLAGDHEARGFADLLFANGMVQLSDENFAEALALFEQALDLQPDDATYRYFVGLCQLELGHLDLALTSLTSSLPPARGRVAESRIRHDLGRTYRLKGDAAAAEHEFRRAAALEGREPAPAEATSRAPRGEFRLGLAFEYDDNPGQVNDAFSLSGSESDRRGVLDFRGGYYPSLGGEAMSLGLVLKGYASQHDDFKAADLTGVQGVVQAAWGVDPLGYFSGPLGYVPVPVGQRRIGVLLQAASSYFDLDGDSFKRDHELAASLLIGEPGVGKTQIDLAYADVNFLDSFYKPLGYSGHDVTLRASQFFHLGRPDRYVRVALSGTAHSREQAGVERDTRQALSELVLPLRRRCALLFYLAYAEAEYDEASTGFFFIPERREDRRIDLVATFFANLTPYTSLTVRYGWIDRDVDPLPLSSQLSYERSIASAGIQWHW